MLKLTLQGFPSFAEVNHYVKSLSNLFLFGCWKHCKACRADQTVNNSKWLKDLIFYAPFFSNSYFYFSSWVMKCYSLYISSFNAQTSVFFIWKSLIWKLTQVLMLADRFSSEIELNITINKVLRCISHGKCIYFFFLFFLIAINPIVVNDGKNSVFIFYFMERFDFSSWNYFEINS